MRDLAFHSEEGASAVMVALLMIPLLGFAALAIDAGALYLERRELQNGADAAVLALAADCASGDTEAACDSGPNGDRYTTAALFADMNASDGAANVNADPSGVEVDYAAGRATVNVSTLDARTGEGQLQHWFAGFLGVDATEVRASATAIWGPPALGSLNTIPLALSLCEWEIYQSRFGGVYASSPWTVENNGAPQVIYFHGDNEDAPPCHESPSGQDLPGGFGWLTNSGTCEADIIDGWVGSDPGSAPDQNACSPEWMAANIYNQVVELVVFDDTNALTGNNAEFHIHTYVAFYVTGYNFGGQYKQNPPCGGSDRCIAGWFTASSTLEGVVDPNAPDTGLRTVQLVQ